MPAFGYSLRCSAQDRTGPSAPSHGTAEASRQEVGVPMETRQRDELHERFVVNPSVVFREMDGEGVLLNLDSGVYFGLDAVGMRIWTLLLEHGTTGPVCAQMEREYRGGTR